MYDCFTGRYSSRNSIESGKSAENRQIGGIIQSGLSRLFYMEVLEYGFHAVSIPLAL